MRIQRMLSSLLAILVIAFGPFIAAPQSAEAANSQYSQQKVWINSGGGILTNGSDGIKLEFNGKYGGGDEIYFANTTQYCCSGVSGVQLAIGNTLYGNSGAAQSAAAFDSLTIGELTGTAINNNTADTQTGSGSVVMTYTKTLDGKQYDLVRRIDYTAPNLYYTETFTVIIPALNTAVVKLYKGGDTAPGGEDSGRALYLSTPVKSVMSIEPTSGIVLGMREIAAETNPSLFDAAVANDYYAPFDEVQATEDLEYEPYDNCTDQNTTASGLRYGAENCFHDVGMYIQYNIGSTPGTYTEENETFVAFQAVNLEAAWSSARVSAIGTLNITMTNQFFATKTGLGYTFTIPAPLTIGEVTNGCGGSFAGTVTVTGNVITVSGVEMAELTSCIVTVTVGRPTAGSTSISSSNVSGLTGDGLVNNVGSSTVTFTAASPTFTPRPATATRTALPPTATATNTATPTNTFTPTPHPFAIKDVAVGASFTLAVLQNGTLVTWGFNREGQASLPRWMATKLVDQVETGSNYAIALGRDGRVYGWGRNDFGQLKFPTAATSGVKSISAGLGHVMAVKTNGDLIIWGRNDFKQTQAPLAARKRITAVAAGHSHSLAIKDGNVIAWGRNTWGQTNVPKNLTNVIAISGGFDHSLALRSNGTIVCWGRNNEDQCKIPVGLTDVIAISAGVGYSMALTRDGDVYAWGRSNFGQANVPTGFGKAGAIAAGYVNSVIGMRDANVLAFGDASLGALVSRTPTASIVP